ncbi:MAG: complex I NDUFA9 subunit family protein [Candidatus Schekmanbacteria bacterium]|nr:complex I NDUFA9 subunit family protein [Candidatus Schekmanbacteria bacterium]
MLIFLTGATGFVGNEILKQLLDKGHQVRCLARSGSEKKLPSTETVEIFNGDVTDAKSLEGAVNGCDAVIHLVGILRAYPAKGITFEKLHYDATRNMVNEARRSSVKRFLHMSALGARPDARSEYHKTKYKAEVCVKESGLTYTIFKPSVIFGHKDKFVNLLAQMIRMAPVVPVIGDGRYKLQPVALENVAQGYINALENPAAFNKVYEVGGTEQLEYNRLLDIIAAQMKRKIIKFHQPLFLLKPAVTLLEGCSFFPLSNDQLIMLQEDSICDNRPFMQDLGIKPISFAEGIKVWL